MPSLPRLLVLWIPDWPVLAHARAERLPAGAPIALVERNEVVACSAAAREEGVRRGMRQREAQARCPQLHVLRYDSALDARAFAPDVRVYDPQANFDKVKNKGWSPLEPVARLLDGLADGGR